MHSERGSIQLPHSSGVDRRAAYLKLLRHVDPGARNGFGFEGVFFKCGSRVSAARLRPSFDFPEIPILLEHSTAAAEESGGPRRRPSLYVLWRWMPDKHEFQEVGRSSSYAWEWAVDLRPLAVRALAEARGAFPPPENAADLTMIARKITVFTDKSLSILAPPDREKLLGILHDYFASRLSA